MAGIDSLQKNLISLFVVGLLAVIFLVVLGQLSTTVKDTDTLVNDNITTITEGVLTSTNDEIVTLLGCYDELNDTILTVASTCNLSNAATGEIYVDPLLDGTFLILNYTYLADSESSTFADDVIDGFSDITSWFSLLILMAVVVIVMGAVYLIRSYSSTKR